MSHSCVCCLLINVGAVSLVVWLFEGVWVKNKLWPPFFPYFHTTLQQLCLCSVCSPPSPPRGAAINPCHNQLPPAAVVITVIAVISPPSPVMGRKLDHTCEMCLTVFYLAREGGADQGKDHKDCTATRKQWPLQYLCIINMTGGLLGRMVAQGGTLPPPQQMQDDSSGNNDDNDNPPIPFYWCGPCCVLCVVCGKEGPLDLKRQRWRRVVHALHYCVCIIGAILLPGVGEFAFPIT